jgi:hypothetical protein
VLTEFKDQLIWLEILEGMLFSFEWVAQGEVIPEGSCLDLLEALAFLKPVQVPQGHSGVRP